MLVWPNRDRIDRSVRDWLATEAGKHHELRRFGYFGSYARGDWGVGSDLDLIAIVSNDNRPFEQRAFEWPTERLPVPAELVVYTEEEWDRLRSEGNSFVTRLLRETVWIHPPV